MAEREALFQFLRRDFVLLYDAVDKAEKFDTDAGDSAVSIVLWSWRQRYEELVALQANASLPDRARTNG